jgi:glycosyltransferase involved in cell wall biosynthesis
MKIAYILPSLAKKGPIIVVYDLINELIKCKEVDEIIVYYFDDIRELNFPCKTIKISFWKSIDFDNFDIIHAHMLRPDIYVFLRKIIGKIKKAKLISTLHQYNYPILKYGLKSKFKAYVASLLWNVIFLSPYDVIVCLTEDMMKYYKRYIGLKNKNIRVINNGRPLPHFNEDINKDDEIFKTIHKDHKDSIIIGTSCLLTKIKGLEQVIKILPEMPDAYFVIIGDGIEKNNLETLARNLGVYERCIFLGFKKNPYEYYKYFDVFVLPSRSEGFPLSIIEAASMKKSIVCSNMNVFLEIFSENEVTFFKLDNLKDLKQKILYAFYNKEQLANNVYKIYLEKYTSQVMAKKYFALYKELIDLKS